MTSLLGAQCALLTLRAQSAAVWIALPSPNPHHWTGLVSAARRLAAAASPPTERPHASRLYLSPAQS